MRRSTSKLAAEAISKTYRGRTVVRDVHLQIHGGEIVGLLGPNGAGKTTTFYMVMGLIPPDAGTVSLDDIALTHLPIHQRAQLGLGYLPQEASIFRNMTVEENLLAILEIQPYSRVRRHQRVEELLTEFQLMDLRTMKGRALSGGERRRVELARLLATSPRFILLDEPFTGIDPLMTSEMQTLIFALRNQGIGILITDHRVRELLEITDRVYMMYAGEIMHSGTPQELVENHTIKQIYLGETFSQSSFTDGHQRL